MIGNSTRRRLIQSTAYNLRFQQRCGKRPLCSSLTGTATTISPANLYQIDRSTFLPARSFSSTDSNIKHHRFEHLDLDPLTLKALRRQGIHKTTEVQQKTYDAIRSGSNVVARSRTGTGKTLAFLVPSIDRFLARNNIESAAWGIPILVLAPTRELAAQIGKEAEKLLSVHRKHGRNNLSSQVIYGGSSKKEDMEAFHKKLPTILVATPGRLKDHLATTRIQVPLSHEYESSGPEKYRHVPFRSALQNGNLQTLVLDETDRLLELGFRRDVQDILSCLNQNDDKVSTFDSSSEAVTNRQTLLFSATLAPDILDVVDMAIAPTADDLTSDNKGSKNYEMIDCVHEEDLATHTNANTSQSYIVLPPERFWIGTIEFILQLMTANQKKKKNKIIVFFEMTRLAQLYAKFLSLRLGHTSGVWELHGKMHQRERTVVTRRFRNAPHGVLLTSDVSARGVDYPGVTHVVQVGAPQNRETYIHRLGRTGRAGKDGAGILVLPEHEQDFLLEEFDGLGLEKDQALQQGLLSKKGSKVRMEIENELGMLKHDLQSGRDHTGMAESLTLAYHSLVSYYFQTRRRKANHSKNVTTQSSSMEATVTILNQLIQDFGLPELPAIGFQRAKNMGIDHLSGHLNIRKDWDDQNWTISKSVDSKNQGHGDFDDWFGLDREMSSQKPAAHRPTKKSGTTNFKSNKPRSSKAKQTKKKKESRFDDRQRYDHSGELPN